MQNIHNIMDLRLAEEIIYSAPVYFKARSKHKVLIKAQRQLAR